MKNDHAADTEHYRRCLEAFLQERHPRLVHARQLIETRSRAAASLYRESVAAGEDTLRAATRADALRLYLEQHPLPVCRRGRPPHRR